MNTPSDTELHTIIGRIYDSVAEPEALNDVLSEIARRFDAKSAVLFTPALPRERGGLFLQHNQDPAEVQRYSDYYFGLDLWWQAGSARAARGEIGIVTGAELVEPAVFERSEFYNDFLKPTDTYHVVAAGIRVLTDAPRFDVSLAFHGNRRHRGFGATEKGLLNILVPHLHRALQLSARIGGALDGLLSGAVDALECLADGVFLLAADGGVMHATRSALKTVSAGGLRLRNGRLSAWLSRDSAELSALLDRASGREGTPTAGTIAMHAPNSVQPLVLSVFPLPSRLSPLSDATTARMLLILRDCSRHHPSCWDIFGRYFGITPAELRLCHALFADETLPEYCARNKISENTGRSQLKSVFSKTGVRRQSELLRLISAFR